MQRLGCEVTFSTIRTTDYRNVLNDEQFLTFAGAMPKWWQGALGFGYNNLTIKDVIIITASSVEVADSTEQEFVICWISNIQYWKEGCLYRVMVSWQRQFLMQGD